MNTLHLTYAVEVERCGSITQAAENLYMAQPNLSKAIKELEESMGFAIFSRTSRGVLPTARGKKFLVYAQAILAEEKKMETLRAREAADLRLAVMLPGGGAADACLARLIARLRTEAGFPHEVGLFLGYLPADADGFMRRKDECKLCGL